MNTKREHQRARKAPWQFLATAITLLLLGLSLPQTVAAADDEAGKVIFIFGDAWRHTQVGEKSPITRGMPLSVGDTIETASNGQVQIRMNDNGLIAVRPSSQFKIKEFHYSGVKGAGSEADKSYFQLLQGGFRSITGAVGENNKKAYKVITPVATIGIRGTDYSVRLCDGSCIQADGLYVGVWQGGVSLNNEGGVLSVDAGHYGYVADAQTKGQPVDSLPADLLLAATGSGQQGTGGSGDGTVVPTVVGAATPQQVALPVTGTADYGLASPADMSATGSNGTTMVSGDVALTANFTTQTVDAGVSLNMSDASTWNGAASGMTLQENGGFSGAMSSVLTTPTATTTSGTISGGMTGMGNGTPPAGASVDFSMTADSNSVSGQADLQLQ